jgi:hypothetical protein
VAGQHNRKPSTTHEAAQAMACGGGKQQLRDDLPDSLPRQRVEVIVGGEHRHERAAH